MKHCRTSGFSANTCNLRFCHHCIRVFAVVQCWRVQLWLQAGQWTVGRPRHSDLRCMWAWVYMLFDSHFPEISTPDCHSPSTGWGSEHAQNEKCLCALVGRLRTGSRCGAVWTWLAPLGHTWPRPLAPVGAVCNGSGCIGGAAGLTGTRAAACCAALRGQVLFYACHRCHSFWGPAPAIAGA
jgi:hypothetical protein